MQQKLMSLAEVSNKEMSYSVFGQTEKEEGIENEPAPVSLRPVRSGRLPGFEVSPPCTVQSQCLYFRTSQIFANAYLKSTL